MVVATLPLARILMLDLLELFLLAATVRLSPKTSMEQPP
jgi:hypothetical protein